MAKVYENECVSCDLPCMGNDCPNRNVPHYYCDGECEEEYEPNELYDFDSEMLCAKCLLSRFEKIKE